MDFGGFLTGMGQGAVKKATGTDPLSGAQGGMMQSAPVTTASAPTDGMHWSVLPMIGSALGLGGQQGSSQGGSNYSILPILSNILSGAGGKGKTAAPQPSTPVPAAPTQAPVTTQPAAGTAPAGGPQQPINTQNHVGGFHGAVPMISNWVDNHHAAARDASAQPHIQALQNPDITPEQRQYSVSHLQNIYSGQPQVLKQMGIPAQTTGYYVPSVGQTAGGK